jgi:hypothetical protein
MTKLIVAFRNFTNFPKMKGQGTATKLTRAYKGLADFRVSGRNLTHRCRVGKRLYSEESGAVDFQSSST